MAFQYMMVQIRRVSWSIKRNIGAMKRLFTCKQLPTQRAQKGWEFFRVDTIGVVTNPGCFGIYFRRATDDDRVSTL